MDWPGSVRDDIALNRFPPTSRFGWRLARSSVGDAPAGARDTVDHGPDGVDHRPGMKVARHGGEADVLIVTAVPDEWDAVLAVDTGAAPGSAWEKDTASGQEVAYRDFTTDTGILRVAVVQALGMGREEAVMTATSLLERRPGIRCLAMCGVCAGRRGEVALGDVIIADRTWPYDQGKVKVSADDQGQLVERFQGDMDLHRIHPPEWKQQAERFKPDLAAPWIKERPRSYEEQGDWVLERLAKKHKPTAHRVKCPDWEPVLEQLWKMKLLHNGTLKLTRAGDKRIRRRLEKEPNGLRVPAPFKVVVGPIASGAAVVEDPTIFDHLANTAAMRKVVGLEMETSAILALASRRRIPYAVVSKGVMDHADGFKSDNMKPFAARASAECLIAFLRQHLPPRPTRQIFHLTKSNENEAFYEQVVRSIDAARGVLYASGRGFSGDGMEGWPRKLIEAERRALRRGCKIVRIHVGTTASAPWMAALAKLMVEHPKRLTVYLDPTAAALVNARLYDPGTDDAKLQLLVESRERESGRIRDYPLLGISLEGSEDLTRQVRALFETWIEGKSPASVAAFRASGPAPSVKRRPAAGAGRDYFAYGSNLSTAQMSRRCPEACVIGPATLADWALTFDVDAPQLGGAAAGIRRSPGSRVHGVLYALTPADQARLHRAEAGGYEPRSVVVSFAEGGREHDAYVYVPLAERAPPPPERWRPPLGYLRTMIRGAREHGLRELLASLEGLAARPTSDSRPLRGPARERSTRR
jgi:nucleoside phosphorylase